MMVHTAEDTGDEAPKLLPRWAMGVTGLLLTIAGTVAVFVKDTNVAGVPLLIVSGAGFLYVALTGQRLIQVNKDGVTFARAKKLESTLIEVSKDPDIPEATKERIVDAARANGIDLAPRVSGYELEEKVRHLLLSVGTQHAFDVQRDSSWSKAGCPMKSPLRLRPTRSGYWAWTRTFATEPSPYCDGSISLPTRNGQLCLLLRAFSRVIRSRSSLEIVARPSEGTRRACTAC
jgi:hypothetical protein